MSVRFMLAVQSGSQRRSAARYRLRLPVIFHWTDQSAHTEGGFTCDVSLDGALIQSSKCPPIGSDVRIEVLIPSVDGGEEVRVQCQGKVTRITSQGAVKCFGVEGSFNDDQLTRRARKKGSTAGVMSNVTDPAL